MDIMKLISKLFVSGVLILSLGACSSTSDKSDAATQSESSEQSGAVDAEESADFAQDNESSEFLEDSAEEGLDEDVVDEFAEEDSFGEEEFVDELAEDGSQTEKALDDEFASAEPSEEVLQQGNGDEFATAPVEALEEQTAAGDEFANTSIVDSGVPKTVQNVEFKANANGGAIVITTDQSVQYSTRQNAEDGQFVIELQNTKLPKQFQRPYNTKEFNGAIGLFQGYQNPGVGSARFVIQLENDGQPLVQQEGNQLLIVASAGGELREDIAVSNLNEPANVVEDPPMPGDVAATEQPEPDLTANSEILQSKSLQEYLSGNNKFYGKKINIEVKDWEVRDVFDFIAEQSGLNLVLSEEVKGTISLKLRDIPWDQALVIVMQSKQLGYIRQGKVLRVAPLQRLRAESENARQVMEAQSKIQPLQVKILPISYAKAQDLEKQVQDLLTANRGKVKADERTNSLIVTDVGSVITKISKLVNELDRQTPQVLIEAKIIEARESFSQEFGINWSADGSLANGGVNGRNTAVSSSGFPSSSGKSNLSFIFGNVNFAGNLTAALNLFEEDELVKVISSPRVIGLNKKEAVIQQITEIPIRKQSGTGPDATVSIEYKPVSLSLKVIPQITAEGGIIMDLELSREFAGAADEEGNKELFKRSAKTTLLVNNGDTAVIGGIYQSDSTSGRTGVPWISKVPILGWLFKSESESVEKNELMMFISPRVLNVDEAFSSELSEAESDQQFIDDI